MQKARAGRVWMQNGEDNICIPAEDLIKYEELGYIRDRLIKSILD